MLDTIGSTIMISNPEIHSPVKIIETAQEYWLILSLLAASAPLIFGLPFSWNVAKQIRKRDRNRSAQSGNTGKLEAAHINHNQRNKNYDDPSNGRLLTTTEHYLDHYYRHGRNGLTKSQNIWALKQIWERLTDEEKESLPHPDTMK